MTYQFKIQIKGITKPPVWRRVLVPDAITFQQLHFVIQEAFGWENAHLYSFSDKAYGGSFYISEPDEMDAFSFVPRKDASKLKLRTFLGKDSSKSLVYWYDFGDDWIHTIKLEAVSDEALLHARCLAGKGTCPPEDCGGVPGYEYMKGLLEEDPESEEAQEMREWLGLEDGETWDANHFNLEETNLYLSQL